MTNNSNGSEGQVADGSTSVRLVTARIFRWISFAFLGLCTFTAQAAGEWIEDFPNVTAVARAVSGALTRATNSYALLAGGG